MSQKLVFTIEEQALQFLKEAGKLAIAMRDNAKDYTKEDGTIVTDVDLAISKLFAKQFAEYFKSEEHVLIDEESANKTPAEVFASNAKYIWTLDPVDGTDPFANDLPLWGIQIGVLKDNKPWLGFVFQPDFNTLIVHNGNELYKTQNAFSHNEKKLTFEKGSILKPKGKQFIGTRYCKPINKENNYKWGFLPGTACCALPWVALGGFTAECIKNNKLGSIWDWAPAWPMLEHCGKQFRCAETGEIQTNLQQITSNKWKFNKNLILSDLEDFNQLKKIIKFEE